MTLKRLFYHMAVFFSWWNAIWPKAAPLHKDRFSLDHEVADLTTDSLPTDSLLLGNNHFSRILHVQATPERRELGNILIQAPTGGGKGLLAVCQLLTWRGSVVVFDIKGDLYKQTAGYRATLGRVYRFDTRGNGHCYDPLHGKHSEDELYAIAHQLMYEPHEADGKAFTQRGTKMLTIIFLAGREYNRMMGREDAPLLPFVGHMADLGLKRATALIYEISPDLCRRFLDEDYDPDKDYKQDKYLSNSWDSATARLYPLLTERILRCFNGSDFTAADIIGGRKPVTVYLCIPEKDLFAKAPVIRLVMESLMAEMKDYFDDAPGDTAGEKGCREVLYLLDEAGNIKLPSLPHDFATVRSRGISIWAAFQDNAQIESQYPKQAKAIRNNADAKLFYRQSEYATAKDIAESLGYRSAFARSQTLREGQAATEGLSEQAVYVLTPRDIYELAPDQVIARFSNRKPIWLKRMDWQGNPILKKRRAIPAPPVNPLPPLDHLHLSPPRQDRGNNHIADTNTLWQRNGKLPNGYIDPDKRL
jgi:type IV secretion system protein VirD4